MVTDQQVRRLIALTNTQPTLAQAAAKAGMDEKTARKWRRQGKLPSECPVEHTWKTRTDPFAEVWEEIAARLKVHPGLQAKTLFEDLQRRFPGQFADGQVRTLQRRIKHWRITEGPEKEVFFAQEHRPGEIGASDFTHMSDLNVTIAGQPFPHLLYHFVLTYSNWETGTLCFSESLESLSEGLQNALWEVGGVPKQHRTDRLTAAVHSFENSEEFTRRYQALLDHYKMQGIKGQAGHGNENGDVEQRHRRLKEALDQALLLREHRDFESRSHYQTFLRELFTQLNAGRRARFQQDRTALRSLPARRLESVHHLEALVSTFSTIRVGNNTYSVPARLIGATVDVRLGAETLQVWYGQRQVETLPRLRGQGRHHIQYRHIIDWLVRKPGAFANYRYQSDLFPTSRFRMAYDLFVSRHPARASHEYLAILYLAAKESEVGVDDALRFLLATPETLSAAAVEALVRSAVAIAPPTAIEMPAVDLSVYDRLLSAHSAGEVRQ